MEELNGIPQPDVLAMSGTAAPQAEALAEKPAPWKPELRPVLCFGCHKLLETKAIRLELGGEPRAKAGRRGNRRGATVLRIHARCQRAALDRWIKARVPA